MMPNMYNGLSFEPYQQQMNQPVGYPTMQQPNMFQQPRPMNPMMPQQIPPQQSGMMAALGIKPNMNPKDFETPQITMGEPGKRKKLFTVVKDQSDDNHSIIKVDNRSDMEIEEAKRKKSKKRIDLKEDGKGVIKVDKKDTTIEPSSTIYSYSETNNLLHETLGQIDAINSELVQEFNSVRHNRTMKNKYMVLNNLSENIGSLISNRINTIKEINNCISKSNDMDYKKYKDIQAAQATMNDDKYVADVYQAFMANPNNLAPTYQMPPIDPSVYGSGIIRATVTDDQLKSGANANTPMDVGYLNYLANMTPEERLMRYENDPDVQQVVVYDASSGSRFFQVMNTRTGEVIPNVPVYDNIILEDTTLDLNTGIAKNININQTFPIVQINNEVTSKY